MYTVPVFLQLPMRPGGKASIITLSRGAKQFCFFCRGGGGGGGGGAYNDSIPLSRDARIIIICPGCTCK